MTVLDGDDVRVPLDKQGFKALLEYIFYRSTRRYYYGYC